jgi:hypothetical protein
MLPVRLIIIDIAQAPTPAIPTSTVEWSTRF